MRVVAVRGELVRALMRVGAEMVGRWSPRQMDDDKARLEVVG